MREEITNKSGPEYLGQLEKVLERNGAKAHTYVVGAKISIADLKLFHMVERLKSGQLDHIPTTLTDAYPLITAAYAAVHAVRSPK